MTPKTLTNGEIHDFLTALSGNRDFCMGLLMIDAGLRVGELVQLRQSDLYFHGCIVSQLVVRANISKTKTERIIPLSLRLTAAIQSLKSEVWMPDINLTNHYAFYTRRQRSCITTRQVERIINHAGWTAIGRRVTPHMLRHTFGTRVLKKSNIRVAQELLGHARITSTQIYTHVDADDCRVAIDALGSQ